MRRRLPEFTAQAATDVAWARFGNGGDPRLEGALEEAGAAHAHATPRELTPTPG